MKRYKSGKGLVDTVFEAGHQITEEEIKRARGKRRLALKEAQQLQQAGFERHTDFIRRLDFSLPNTGVMRTHVYQQLPADCHVWAPTDYVPRGAYGRPQLHTEQWVRSYYKGTDIVAIIMVALYNYISRPQYRLQWEAKLALEMSQEEIETELMLHELGKEVS